MSTRKRTNHGTQERRKAAVEAARQAATRRNQPNDIAEKALMKRQSKKLHLRDHD
jgi:hypothetical protein